MKVSVCSFSYKRGLPADPTGNGGGFVFDCRVLPNPFWVKELRGFTGRDQPIGDFFAKHQAEVDGFLRPIRELVLNSVRAYEEEGRGHLFVAFGCTGGQHRSVYCAERFAAMLKAEGRCEVELVHAAQTYWKG